MNQEIAVEKVGESIVIVFPEGVTIMLATEDALRLGTLLIKVGALGGDSLDYELPEINDEGESNG